ncbi:DinB family protein [Paenibacillus aestuarii]|uniref:DinB family protein n=1 Tax=Paenibacillus aestuarii TaxID=516965 RepID=A0ABW0K1X8_9BACL|nr:DinB family protein [Paenibacillus aestuarii]
MILKTEFIQRMEPYLDFVQSLETIAEGAWTSPLAEGKWRVCDVISHMMLWDRRFMEMTIEPIALGTPLTYKSTDFHAFNRSAAVYASQVSKDQLLGEALRVREQILAYLRDIPEAKYAESFLDGDGHPFTLPAYVEDFAEHDHHHSEQIRQLLNL